MTNHLELAIKKIEEALSAATSPADVALLTERLIQAVEKQIQLDDKLWTLEDVARYTSLRPDTIRKMVCAQQIPAIRLNSITRFDRAKIVSWFREKQKKDVHAAWR